jgi:hypothetical protein
MRCTMSRTVVRGNSCSNARALNRPMIASSLILFQGHFPGRQMTASCRWSRLRWLAEKKNGWFRQNRRTVRCAGGCRKRGENVDDAAADAKIARFLNNDTSCVAAGRQLGDEGSGSISSSARISSAKSGEHGFGDQFLAEGGGGGDGGHGLRGRRSCQGIQGPDAAGGRFVVVGHEFERRDVVGRKIERRRTRFPKKETDFRLPLFGGF